MPVDESAIATWANVVTVTRVLASPFLFAILPSDSRGSWVALALWVVLCSSDAIDGHLARRHGTTRSGAFLDPLADKILILGAMFTLVSRGIFWLLPVSIIAGREILVSAYRVVVGSKGVSVPATKLAKWKTLFQQLAVGFAIAPMTTTDATWLWLSFLWAAVALTIVTGLQYAVHAVRAR
ncbi:MAG: CDP-diacylglycerol--glycerol-3-phosphate 3-phosphatidyltransferase [Actinomycetota bacterium]|jgi:CDP-diacylglycerol--glycerol-3-phosphate 3-phosphatidyltransferase